MANPTASTIRTLTLAALVVVVLGLAWWSRRSPIGSERSLPSFDGRPSAEVAVSVRRLVEPSSCSGRFVRHELDHETRTAQSPAPLYDSNGSGVAAGDLDGDGLPDLVFGNLEGPNTILWNEGDWRFTTDLMTDRATRAVQLVDLDGDGLLDIVTSHRAASLAAFRNLGNREFDQIPLPGVGAPAYSMAWGDYDSDGDLDLVTGSYDAELDQRLRSTFLFSDGAGVYLYENTDDGFEPQRLAGDSQALAASMIDIDGDEALDLLIGNDFAMRDMAWLNRGDEMIAAEPFPRTAAHTMSLDLGDVDGDGVFEVFATDMSPASNDTETVAEWLPLMATMEELDNPADPQKIRNVLWVDRGSGRWDETAERAGIDSAGWAWSGRFGDLDNDGDVDLHVVNGMIAAETFWYLDGAEIVEPNVAFRNNGSGRFDIVDWGLGALDSGRGSVLVDLDLDGRLDVVVNNLGGPATAFENSLCVPGAIEIDLIHPASDNRFAVGARVALDLGDRVAARVVSAGGGYLSGSSPTLHLGVGEHEVGLLEIVWPDGAVSTVPDLEVGTHVTIARLGDDEQEGVDG